VRALAAALCLAACASPTRKGPGDDPSVIAVDEARAVVRTGGVGATSPVDATYALADVTNRSGVDRLVTVGGVLLDEAGAEVGRLAADELRVPAGATRAYALVAERPVPAARRARFTVANAVALDYPPQVVVEGEKASHGDLTVVAATVRNVIDKEATAVVVAAFRAGDGRLLSRPFTVVPLAPGASRAVRFEGAKEAARAEIFIGQVAFH
jgi:hypothetical protein